MKLVKNTVTLLFSEMYFDYPYIKTLHKSLLKQIISYVDVYGYPIEYTDKTNKIIKDWKKVKIIEENIIKINYSFIDDEQIFDNKYYLYTTDISNKKELIPFFPPIITDNINKYREILKINAAKSTYLIS